MSAEAYGAVAGGLIDTGMNYIGMRRGEKMAREMSDKEYERQKEFAQHGIQWRMEDAKKAGIHPLAALGASGSGYSPSTTIGGGGFDTNFESMGQNIDRSIMATQDKKDRSIMATETLRNARLKNDLLEAQISQIKSPGNPPFPTDQGLSKQLITGQSGSEGGRVKLKPSERTMSQPGNPAMQAGHISDYGLSRTTTGLAIIPSSDVKERIEDQMIPEIEWAIRNRILPAIKGHPAPSTKDFPLPPGQKWKWNPWRQEYQPTNRGGKTRSY